jgi:hypothetical protein
VEPLGGGGFCHLYKPLGRNDARPLAPRAPRASLLRPATVQPLV